MKHIAYVFVCSLLLAVVSITCASAQSDSLGTYARTVRKDKKQAAAKQYDNDNLPVDDQLSTVGKTADDTDKKIDGESQAEAAQASGEQSAKADEKSADAAAGSNSKADDGSEAKEQLYKDWQKKISSQKDQVDLLTRELDVQQREYRLRAAAFYADAGNRLRNSGSWDQEDSQYKQQIAEKQKALDKAKAALDELQEQARKAGVPSGLRE